MRSIRLLLQLIGISILVELSTSIRVSAQSSYPLLIKAINKQFYVYTTFNMYKGQRFPANGMYIVTNKGVIIIDSPWDTTQFQVLLDTIYQRHHQKAVLCVATHFHEDRTGALAFFRSKKVATFTSAKTDSISQQKKVPRAEYTFQQDTLFRVGGIEMQTFFPGAGHTTDNLVIWFPKQKVLYGGCLIKSTADSTLGNTTDGNLTTYASSVKKVMDHFPYPSFVIPGHQDWMDNKSIEHTLQIANAAGKVRN